MLTIRRPREDEIPILKEIHKQFEDEFEFPNPDALATIYVVLDGDDIIGFGAIQHIFEAVLVLDQTKSKKVRLKAIAMLQQKGEEDLKDMDQLHAFVQNTKVENLLKNKFGYKNTKGHALVKIIERNSNGQG
jgi:hypothetical protein